LEGTTKTLTNSEFITPGSIKINFILKGAISNERAWLQPSTANFVAQYADWVGTRASPEMEPILIIIPIFFVAWLSKVPRELL
jgi:hypothetical protein